MYESLMTARPQPAGAADGMSAMPAVREPTPELLDGFLARQEQRPFSYDAVGATNTHPPAGYRVNHTRCPLGQGEDVFAAACAALRSWRQFTLPWLRLYPPLAPIQAGQVVIIVARAVGLWWLNPCRIVYVIDETNGAGRRFGFAYGTLPGHAGRGEERFLVEMEPGGRVMFDVFAFSRPGHFAARLGCPLMRRYQRRFGHDSAAAMLLAVTDALAATGRAR